MAFGFYYFLLHGVIFQDSAKNRDGASFGGLFHIGIGNAGKKRLRPYF